MLSLSPRFDLFQFKIPKDYFPQEVFDKYYRLINENKAVIYDPVDMVNESIQAITIPGIGDLTEPQPQTSTNANPTGKMRYNHEPAHDNFYKSPANPIELMEKEFTVTFRQNQGLLNYFMMYETLFHHMCKPLLYQKGEDVFIINILSETGVPYSQIMLYQPIIIGIDGLEFSYSKAERDTDTFNVKFNFNNLNFDFIKSYEDIASKKEINVIPLSVNI